MPTFREDTKIGSKVPLIKTADLNDKSVTERKLADESVTKDKIATGAITKDGINNKAVTNVKIDDAAVDTRTIEDKSVTNAKIADESITQEKIFNSSVTTEKLADESVSAEKLQSGLRSTIVSTHDKAIELDKKKANITDVDYALECLENKIGDRVVVEGNVTNLPDDEDLTSVRSIDGREVMKLNDRAYEPSNFSGKGYKILRKNIQRLSLPTATILVSNIPSSSGSITITINGKATTVSLDVATDTTTTIIATKIGTAIKVSLDDYDVSVSSNTIVLTRNNSKYASPSSIDVGNTTAGISVKDSITKSERKNVLIQDMINDPNTVYEIRYDFDLNGDTINIPESCTLKFNGGSLNKGTIVFDNTFISVKNNKLNILPVNCTGSVKNLTIYPEWFNNTKDYTQSIQTCINIATETAAIILFTGDRYLVRGGVIFLKSNITFKSKNKSVIYTEDEQDYYAIFQCNTSLNKNITFDGIIFDQTKQVYCTTTGNVQMFCIVAWNIDNLIVKNCVFICVGGNTIVAGNFSNEKIHIDNNDFYFIRNKSKENNNYDNSIIYVTSNYHIIENNRIINDGTLENRSKGGIETHGSTGFIRNNTITNCNNAINIVENDIPIDIEPNRMITGNICYNCDIFCALWPVLSSKTIKNVVIANNSASNIQTAVSCVIGSDLQGNIQDVKIHTNYFSGNYTEYTSTYTDAYLKKDAAFAFFSYGNCTNLEIYNNIISNFPNKILSTNPYSSDEKKKQYSIFFTNNICSNCFNSKNNRNTLVYEYTLFYIGFEADITVENNIFIIPKTIRNNMVGLYFTSYYGIKSFKYHSNIIKGDITSWHLIGKKTDINKVDTDLESPKEPRIFPYDIVGNRLLYPKDTILGNNTYKVKSIGHFNNTPLDTENIEFKVVERQIATLTGTGVSNLQIGDKLSLILEDGAYKCTVIEHLDSFVYIQSDSLFGASVKTIKSLKYIKAEYDTYPNTITDISNLTEKLPKGTVRYDTTTNRLVVYDGTQWKDTENLANISTKGDTSNRPTLKVTDSGTKYYDTTLKKYIVWNGTEWTNMDGTALG